MYVIDKLKEIYPEKVNELDEYDKILRRYHKTKDLEKIFDSNKENFKFLVEAYKIGPGHKGYIRQMAYYEKSLSYDKDFLIFYIKEFSKSVPIGLEDKTVEELREIAG